MRARLLTAAVGIPVVIAALYFGGPVFFIFMALFSLGAMFEFARMLGLSQPLSAAAGGTIVIPYYLNLYFHFIPWDAYLLLYIIIAASIFFVFCFSKLSFQQSSGLIFGGIYITVLASTLALVRNMDKGMFLTLAVFLVTWGTDSGAFFVGMLLGKRKLAPAISPNKSWAGALGGFISGIIIATAIGILIKGNVLIFFLWGCAGAIFGQIGDLCESAFKRFAGVKDSGKFFPGHGGFLDRIDSLLFVSALAYIFFGVLA
jgi:phosphatidate cytidylyltransferase